jgi:hypothetical protein
VKDLLKMTDRDNEAIYPRDREKINSRKRGAILVTVLRLSLDDKKDDIPV